MSRAPVVNTMALGWPRVGSIRRLDGHVRISEVQLASGQPHSTRVQRQWLASSDFSGQRETAREPLGCEIFRPPLLVFAVTNSHAMPSRSRSASRWIRESRTRTVG